MSFKKEILTTLCIQVIGVGGAALSKILVSRLYGPQGQGYYSYILSLILLWSSIGQFGFPQSLLYLLNEIKINCDWTKSFIIYYSFLLYFISLAIFIVVKIFFIIFYSYYSEIQFIDSLNLNLNEFFLVSLSSIFLIFTSLSRIINLSEKKIVKYNLVTISNNVLFILFLIFIPFKDYTQIKVIIFISYAISAMIGFIFIEIRYNNIANIFSKQFNSEFFKTIKNTFFYSLWSFFPSVAINLNTTITYWQLINGSENSSFAGYFSTSLLLLSFALLPLNLISPILFNHWSKNNHELEVILISFKKISRYGIFLFAFLTITLIILSSLIIPIIFGKSFQPSVLPTQIILLGIYPNYRIRLYHSFFLSIGYPRKVAIAELLRTILLLALMSFDQFKNPLSASVIWSLTSIICCGQLYYFFVQTSRLKT
ncbi:hypothetical protein A2T98_02350 [Nodularia spumigena CENA596]|uniref:Polysaccharide biosynthesis protein n=1 Tax=Nodularia spumigena CENA596 TaxID=1819295 RepID=A0A161VVL2_NODSP|nr:oligosaccharide flippase family protein [Nodularia spumigena]KZL51435.1 hypothetical protein A2T98_02350 [Nodularia spumigena CENA596]